jgi:mono/diheme cytochrome c family protein
MIRVRLTTISLLSTLFIVLLASTAAAEDAAVLTYESHIRPIFRAHCFDCHGAADELKGKLDLRLVRLMQKGGEGGPVIVPGKPSESYLLQRIKAGEMPPGEKSLSAAEIRVIEQWIAAGAKTARPEPESIGPGLGITLEERSFWSFQPIQRPIVTGLSSESRTPIDELILRQMPDGMTFSPDADRRTLIKRAYFDLTGLPPTPNEMQKWLDDDADGWFDRLLTALLGSPHYGERWGRHWLDVAGYADSEGYTVKDDVRPWAYKYRDWVIRALNEDKPFDRFIIEQLAGDELAGPRDGDLTPEQIDLLTATGFLRMSADGTGSGANNPDGQNQVITDTLKIIGTSLLGLSIQCAQCHDHRYDPIPHTDYYALRAVFEPALDWKAWKVPNARRVSLYTAADRKKAAEIEAEAKTIGEERGKKQSEFMQQALDKELVKYDEPLRTQLREAYKTPGSKRTEEHKQLLAKNPSVNISPGNLYQYLPKAAEELKKFDQRMKDVRAKKPVEEFLRALVEPPNHLPETKLFHRGDHQQPKQTIMPASLTVAAREDARRQFTPNDSGLPSSGRRLAFARWLTSGEHPLVSRVIVNRIWMHHFGRGLVKTPSDFGKLGARPSHPQLLDWLADEFVQQHWSMKKLHRLIMSSTVWRQSGEVRNGGVRSNGTAEEDSALRTPHSALTRKPLIRLEAEAIRDRMLAASGQLDRTLYGAPIAIKEDDTGQIMVDGGQKRRSLYVQVRRSRPVAMMQAFDAPVMETNCESRSNSTVATQSLMLLNGAFILDQAAKLADRAAAESTALPAEQLAQLPRLPAPRSTAWSYGFGTFDEESNRTASFTRLTHWTGSQWQAGPKLPDPQLGYVLLHANGGHPDIAERAVIRRWTALLDGTVSISGSLSHGSKNGDGVRGRVVSSRSGKAAEWTAFNGATDTPVTSLEVKAGDTIDFVTDCQTSHTSDSFNWPVAILLKAEGQPDRSLSSKQQFRGPSDPPELFAGQVVRAWQLALCRPPSNDELVLAMDFAADQLDLLQNGTVKLPEGRSPVRQVLTNLCQSLMGCNEFLYID